MPFDLNMEPPPEEEMPVNGFTEEPLVVPEVGERDGAAHEPVVLVPAGDRDNNRNGHVSADDSRPSIVVRFQLGIDEEDQVEKQQVAQSSTVLLQQFPRRKSANKYRTIVELYRAPNLPMPPPIRPRAEMNNDTHEIQSLAVERNDEFDGAVIRDDDLESAEAQGDNNVKDMDKASDLGDLAPGPSSQQKRTEPQLLRAHEAFPWRHCKKKYRTIKELYSAPNLPIPPSIHPRVEPNQQLQELTDQLEENGLDEADHELPQAGEDDGDNVMDIDNLSDIVCCQCGSGDMEAELVLCDGCGKGYHTMCAKPILPYVPNGQWICSECSGPPQDPSISEADIINFFGIQDFDTANEGSRSTATVKRRNRGKTNPWSCKSRRVWLPYVPSKDRSKRLKQLGSLAKALLSLNLDFTDDLVYMPEMAPRSANNAALDKSEVQILQKGNKEIWNLCKAMHQRGECPPIQIVYDSKRGYMALADGTIEDKTFICEYTGLVDYSKNRELDDSDSSMNLLETTDNSTDLIVCQDKCGNVGRFLSGINNHDKESKKKQNCTFIRCNVDGECRIFVVSIRHIKAGTALYCDYNAGGDMNAFPTRNFV